MRSQSERRIARLPNPQSVIVRDGSLQTDLRLRVAGVQKSSKKPLVSNDGVGVCTRGRLGCGVIELVDLDIVRWVACVGRIRVGSQTESRYVTQTYHEHDLC